MGDGPAPGRTAAVAFLLTGLLVAVGVLVSLVMGVDPPAAVGATAVAALALVLLLRFVGDDAGVWAAIPDEQYAGQLAESGGLGRSDQGDAVDEGRGQTGDAVDEGRGQTGDVQSEGDG